MPSGIGYGASEGLEKVLSRLFLESQAKQQAEQQARQFELQQARMNQDASQFDATQKFNQDESARRAAAEERQFNATSAQIGFAGTNAALANERERQRDEDASNRWQAEQGFAGTRYALEVMEREKDRASAERRAAMAAGRPRGSDFGLVYDEDGNPVYQSKSDAAAAGTPAVRPGGNSGSALLEMLGITGPQGSTAGTSSAGTGRAAGAGPRGGGAPTGRGAAGPAPEPNMSADPTLDPGLRKKAADYFATKNIPATEQNVKTFITNNLARLTGGQ